MSSSSSGKRPPSPDRWQDHTRDIQCAFFTGSYLAREEELFFRQPATGFPRHAAGTTGPGQEEHLRVGYQPEGVWEDLQRGFKDISIVIGSDDYRFDQCPLDPCIFMLRRYSAHWIRRHHFDDLLAIAPEAVSKLIRQALSEAFPVDEWESELLTTWGPRSSTETARSSCRRRVMLGTGSSSLTSPQAWTNFHADRVLESSASPTASPPSLQTQRRRPPLPTQCQGAACHHRLSRRRAGQCEGC